MRFVSSATELTVRSLMVLAMTVIVGTISLWFFMAWIGIVVSLPFAFVVIAGIVVWAAINSGGVSHTPPPAPPAPPRRHYTMDDANRACVMYSQRLISKEQLDAILESVMPPPRPDNPSDDRGRHGR